MSKKERKIAGTVTDHTVPRTPVALGGKIYNLCFDYGALAEAETAINAELARAGRMDFVNLLFALPVLNFANIRVVFAAAVRKFHPELSYDDALALVRPGDLMTIAEAVTAAWTSSMPESERPADPPPPSD